MPDLDLTVAILLVGALGHHVPAQDLLEPVLLATTESDQLEAAPEEEDGDSEVKSKPEETDDDHVTKIVNKTAAETLDPILKPVASSSLLVESLLILRGESTGDISIL